MKRLFVGNLAGEVKDREIEALFAEFGKVRHVELVTDVFSGRCRGFGFVDMEGHEARAAMEGLNGTMYQGQHLKVREEQPRKGGKGGGKRRR